MTRLFRVIMIFLGASAFLREATAETRIFADTPGWATATYFPRSVDIGDFNNDGRMDLVVISLGPKRSPADSSVDIYLNRDGTFSLAPDRTFPVKAAYDCSIGDFDNDGKSDLAITSGELGLLFGKDDFDRRKALHQTLTRGGTKAQACDVYPDDLKDFLCGPNIVRWRKSGNLTMTCVDLGTPFAIDLDRDGAMDLIALGPKNNAVIIYYGPLPGSAVNAKTVKRSRTINIDSYINNLEVADMDNDGDPDIILGCGRGATNGEILIVKQETCGFPDKPVPLAIKGASGWVTVGDLNGDGKVDILANDYRNGRVFLQKEDATFAKSVDAADQILALRAYQVALTDVDGDGKKDIVGRDAHSSVFVFMNRSSKP